MLSFVNPRLAKETGGLWCSIPLCLAGEVEHHGTSFGGQRVGDHLKDRPPASRREAGGGKGKIRVEVAYSHLVLREAPPAQCFRSGEVLLATVLMQEEVF
jgi:hypothetical protein